MISAVEGYLDMMPHGSSLVSPDHATRSLASRLEVVRSYVQKDSESGDENSDESSVASLGGSDEHLPKERAYSVGCKPPLMSAQLCIPSGTGRPPKAPGKAAEKSTEVAKQRHQDSPGSARARKISVTTRPEQLRKLSSEAAPSKSVSIEGMSAKAASDAGSDKTDRGTAEAAIRPRTSTLPWDLLRGVRNSCDDPLRPRSSSGGNAASIRDAVRSRIAAARHAASSSIRPLAYSDPVHHLAQHRELVCPSEGQETGEYVEMHCPAAS